MFKNTGQFVTSPTTMKNPERLIISRKRLGLVNEDSGLVCDIFKFRILKGLLELLEKPAHLPHRIWSNGYAICKELGSTYLWPLEISICNKVSPLTNWQLCHMHDQSSLKTARETCKAPSKNKTLPIASVRYCGDLANVRVSYQDITTELKTASFYFISYHSVIS